MKKQELLKQFDDELLNKLYGFCYARTNDSYEAQELCSDIIFALVKTAHTDGEIANLYSFIWRVARNVYADFSDNRRKHVDTCYEGDAEEVLQSILSLWIRKQLKKHMRYTQSSFRRFAILFRIT